MRTPVCVYCGSPNPQPLSDWEWMRLMDWAQVHQVGNHVLAAIEARKAANVISAQL